MAMYRIIGADGKEYGPVAAELLRQWISEGRANGQSRVREEGSQDWTALGEIGEFQEVLSRGRTFQPPKMPATDLAPSPALPPDEVLAGNRTLDVGSCVARAIKLLGDHPLEMFVWVAIYVGFYVVFMIASAVIPILPSIAQVFVTGAFHAGAMYYLLRLVRGHNPEAEDFFVGFRKNFVPLMLIYLILTIATVVVMIPGMVIAGVPVIASMVGGGEFGVLHILAICAGGLIVIVPATFISMIWMFFPFLSVVEKGMDFWPAMEFSRKVVMQRLASFIVLALANLLIALCGVLLCGIGILLAWPVVYATWAYAYQDLFCAPSPEATRPANGDGVPAD